MKYKFDAGRAKLGVEKKFQTVGMVTVIMAIELNTTLGDEIYVKQSLISIIPYQRSSFG